jgi:hypothetical protein
MRQAQAPQTTVEAAGDLELVGRARDRDETAIRTIMKSNNRRL